MKKAKIGELRNGLSRYLAYVRAGGSVIVYERDTPIAEITPISRSKNRKQADEERLARLERKGIIRRGDPVAQEWFNDHKPVKIPGAGSLVEAVLEERESGW